MKAITLLLDGIGDRSYESLDHLTPLAYADTPNLNQLALKSQCGLLTPLSYGVSLGTDLAHHLLFNYTLEEYPNRSIIDAYGENLTLDSETLVLRASFANVHKKADGYYINKRFIQPLEPWAINELMDILNIHFRGYDFEMIHSYDSHCFILIKGLGLSENISDSDPFYENQYVMQVEPFEDETLEAKKTAVLVNEYLKHIHKSLYQSRLYQRLKEEEKTPCNFILTKWAGKKKELPTFKSRNGMRGLIIGQSHLLKGLSKILGMDFYKYKDFEEGIQVALESEYDYVHLHTKKPDSAAHTKDVFEKVRVIESIDQQICPLLDFKGVLVVTGDHSTPSAGQMIHSGEHVPLMIGGKYVRRDQVTSFDEVHCSKGSLFIYGKDFMNMINNARDEGKLYHLRAGQSHINHIKRDIHKLL